ncbi:hypothetical protein OTU49_007307, partial [Cherax quadricarinatus]
MMRYPTMLYLAAGLLLLQMGVGLGNHEASVSTGLEMTANEQALRKSLLKNYDKLTIPPGNTTITISSLTIRTMEMHEETQSMEILSYLSHSWMDLRLKWSLEDHMDLDRLGMDPDDIWKPDLTVYNSAREDYHLHQSQLPTLVYPEGRVLFVPPVQLHFTCVMDLTYWPHDKHTCVVKIGSWVHHGFLLDLQVSSDALEFDLMTRAVEGGEISISEWEVLRSNITRVIKYYPCCSEPYITIDVSITLRRSASAYTYTVKIPAVCLSLLTLVVFLLPPGAGEKLIFGGFCLLLNLLFLTYTTQVVVHAPTHTPLIMRLVCQQLVLVLVSVLVAALVVRLARDPHPYPLPNIIKSPLLTLSYFLCLSNYTTLASRTQQEY